MGSLGYVQFWFMTFLQDLAISVLARAMDIGGRDVDGWAQSVQNFFDLPWDVLVLNISFLLLSYW